MENINKRTEVAKLFYEVSKNLKHNMRRGFEELGITLPQSLVIRALRESGEMKITEISRKIDLSNSTISGIVDRLEKQQLVARTRSEVDRRIVYVKVTPRFEEMHQKIYKKAEEIFGDLLSRGTPEEIEKISEGLNILKKILTY